MVEGVAEVVTKSPITFGGDIRPGINSTEISPGQLRRMSQGPEDISNLQTEGEMHQTEPPQHSVNDEELEKATREMLTKAGMKTEDIAGIVNQPELKAQTAVKEKPKGFWARLKEAIKNFFRNLFR